MTLEGVLQKIYHFTSDVILTITITIVIILIIIFKNDKLLPFNCCLKVNKSLLLINMWDAAGFLFCMKKQVFLASLYNLYFFSTLWKLCNISTHVQCTIFLF